MSEGGHPQRSSLLTIGEACRILGVSETTLRQWTDEGKVNAFVTPGGHRRYSQSDLKNLVRGQHRVHDLKDLVAQIESAVPRQREITQQYLRSTAWYPRLDAQAREQMRERGRRLLGLIVRYITKPSIEGEVLQQARRLGQEYGIELARMGLSLSDALEAFTLHRTPVLDAATELMKDNEPVNKRTLISIPRITYLIDQTLLALVEAHQHYSSEHRP